MTEQMFTLNRKQRQVVGVLSPVLLGTVAWAAYRAATKTPPDAFVLGFEGLLALCGVTGILLALGKFRDGPGLALALIAISIVVCTGLGLVSQQLAARQVLRSPWFLGRFGLALAFAGVGAWSVLGRDPRSLRSVRQGAIWLGLGFVTVAAIALVWKVWRPQSAGMKVAAITALLASGVALVAFVSVGINLVIRAFEFGRLEQTAIAPGAARAGPGAGGTSGDAPKSAMPSGQQSSGSTT